MKRRKPASSGSKKMRTDFMQRRGRARLSTEVQRKIGNQLRAMYDDVVHQGVPDRFTELLSQLDERNDKDKK
ncbi:MAG: hypothetical protein GEU91_20440 [Rhizobiales bacterium]|nr:hypothetical protein [Hyphomicrobiales bacterium]